MKKIVGFITSLSFMAFLFLVLIFSMAGATFIESSHGTSAARALVYNAHWFEALWALLAINLIFNLVKFRLYSPKKLTVGIFHISFLFILLGAVITRYFGYEGIMHIREGQTSNSMVSSADYFFAAAGDRLNREKVLFSELTPRQYAAVFNVNGQEVKIKTVGYITDARRRAIPSEKGEPLLDLVFSAPNSQGMQSLIMSRGEMNELFGLRVGFGPVPWADVRFFMQGEELFLVSGTPVEGSRMSDQESVRYPAGDTVRVNKMFLYDLDNFRFLVRNFYPSATYTAVKSESATNEDAVMVELSDGTDRQIVPVFGHSGMVPDTLEVRVGENLIKLGYGSIRIPLSFSLYLKDFQLERYPGSGSPSSYASEVVLIDPEEGVERDVRIFMNSTLLYEGYKFFQSSYDQDEKGTVLSVNHDLWGTWITYIGYALLTLGMIFSLINPNSHFLKLARRLKKGSVKGTLTLLLLGGLVFQSSAQTGQGSNIPDIDDQVVSEFNQLWVLGSDGRIKPMATLAGEIVRKVSRESSLFGKSPGEAVLSMMTYPDIWRTLPIVKVSNKTVAGELDMNGERIPVQQLFDEQGNYRIAEKVRAAYNKSPALRNRVEKEYIYVDERVSICFMVFRGDFFHLFPRKEKEATWYAPGEEADEYSGGDSLFVRSGFNLMLQSLSRQNSSEALEMIHAIDRFQEKYGGDQLPSASKKQVELLYNKVNPFESIFPLYLLFGFILLFILFVNIFRLKPLPGWLKRTFFGLIVILFLIHTAGLIARWYISGHAPWSNGYESVVYVAWAAMLAGLLFGRRYPMVVGTASFLSGIALFVAHLSWMNPEITPLVPVLKSYWLTIHVSVITASYGFIGLSAFLGILVLILIILRKRSNEYKVNIFIDQLTTINEMSVTAGLYFLTIGTFLGAIWANESWGRYWGWDPKETWSLITIVVYSFIVHMRLIPSLKGIYSYNLASVLGFGSVLMTYFGVNYYLTGLHSYGQGVAYGVNPALPAVLGMLAGLMIWAYYKDSKFEQGKTEVP